MGELLDRLATIRRIMRLVAVVLLMVVVVGGSSWLKMWPHPQTGATTMTASGTRVYQPLAPPGPNHAPLVVQAGHVPDLYVVPGVGNFVYLTPGTCLCWPVAYPSDTIFVAPSQGVTPCRCADMRNATPIVPIVHVVSPALPCRCLDTRLTSPSS